MKNNITKPDGIHSFLNDKIFLNNIEYKREDFEKISTESGCSIKTHPLNTQMRVIEIEKDTNINGINCKAVLIESTDGVIDTIILYPYFLSIWIATCSIKCKPDIYDTPLGECCDYVYDESHKITIGPDGSMIYIWYD